MLIIILLSIIIALLFLIFPAGRTMDKKLLRDYAHRGLHGETEDGFAPENSLAAFRRAADAGFGIELDLQLSRDGEVFVFHDYSLARMTGCDKKLSELTADELDKLRLSGGGERIPRLTEVLETVGGRVPLLIELKGESVDTALCPAANAILSEYGGEYIVESFNPMLLNWYRKHRPEIRRGQLYTNVCREKGISPLNILLTGMLLNCLSRPDFVAYDKKSPRAFPLFAATRIFRAARFAWTIRNPSEHGPDHAIFEGFIPKK